MEKNTRITRLIVWLVCVPAVCLICIFLGLFAYGVWLVESPWQDQNNEYRNFVTQQNEYSLMYQERLSEAQETENTNEIISTIIYIQQKDLVLRDIILNVDCQRVSENDKEQCEFYFDMYTAYKNRRILGKKIHELDLTEEDEIEAFNDALENQNSREYFNDGIYENQNTPIVSPLTIFSQVED